MRRRWLLALVLAGVALSGCNRQGSDAGGPEGVASDEGAVTTTASSSLPPHETTSTTAVGTSSRGSELARPQRPSGPAPSVPASAFPSLPPGEFRFELRRDDGRFKGAVAFKIARREVTDDRVVLAWRWHYDTYEDKATLNKRDGAYIGSHIAQEAGEWPECDWDSGAVFLPRLQAGSTASINGSCPFGDGSRHHVEGQVKVVGERTVRIDGAPHQVWAVERRWRQWRDNTNGSSHFETDSLWSPQLEMIVSHNSKMRAEFGPTMAAQEVNSTFRLVGLEL